MTESNNTASSGSFGAYQRRFLLSAGGALVLRIAAAGLGFLIILTLARVLGARDYGVYAYAMAWIGVLGVPATLGFPQMVVRNVAVYQEKGEWALLAGLLRLTVRIVAVVSLVLTVVCGLVVWMWWGGKENNLMPLAFLVALPILPVVALVQIRQAALRGFHDIMRGQLPELLVRPAFFLILLLVLFGLLGRFSAQLALSANFVAVSISLVVSTIWLGKVRKGKPIVRIPMLRVGSWFYEAVPLAMVAGMQTINFQADMLILGAMKGPTELGVYAISRRLSDFLAFGLLAAETAVAPRIASLYASRERAMLQAIVVKSGRMAMAFVVPVVLILAFFGKDLLKVMGPEFSSGFSALMILATAQVINVLFGPNGQLAIHTGHGKGAMVCVAVGACVNISLNFLLVPRWGVVGSAMATGVSLVTWNLLLTIYLYRRTGIRTLAVFS